MTRQSDTTGTGSPESVVLAFVQCFNENRIDDALAMLSEDVVYHNIPMEPLHGRAAAAAFFAQFDLGGALTTEWIVHALATQNDLVLTERTDKFLTAGGSEMAIPIMGIFKVQAGLISEWRDYFDMADFQRQMAGLMGQQVG